MEPGAKLLRYWPLEGGISCNATAFEFESMDGTKSTRIVRTPSKYRLNIQPNAAQDEFLLLQTLKSEGILVPQPYFHIGKPHGPAVVIEYVDGAPELNPTNRSLFLKKYAAQLAQIHNFDLSRHDLSFLPKQNRGFDASSGEPNSSLREAEIRDALSTITLGDQTNAPVLRHGDFWPGNVIWNSGEIAAVIDWEECLIGEPLADLAICRLDLLWIFNLEAMEEFTCLYQELMSVDLRDLAYWDLCASLRPIANIEEWAPAYTHLGRPDITEATMREDHQIFVSQAISPI